MGLETATFIDGLVVTNPEGGDDKRQGDDHLTLIKRVLRSTFPNATKAFYLPRVVTKSANYTLVVADENATIACNTTAGFFTLTLPSTTSLPLGWKVKVVRTAGSGAVFIQPTSGTIFSGAAVYNYVCRSVSGVVTEVEWVGVWVASRPNALPIGTVVDYFGAVVPDGYLLCDGSAVNTTNYQELGTLTSVLPNCQERVTVGKAAVQSLITAAFSGVDSTVLGATGGIQGVQLDSSTLAPHSHPLANTGGGSASASMNSQLGDHLHGWGNLGSNGIFTTFTSLLSGYDLTHTHPTADAGTVTVQSGGGAPSIQLDLVAGGGTTGNSGTLNHAHDMDIGGNTNNVNLVHSHTITLSGSTQSNTGSGGAHLNLQPCIVLTKIIVAE